MAGSRRAPIWVDFDPDQLLSGRCAHTLFGRYCPSHEAHRRSSDDETSCDAQKGRQRRPLPAMCDFFADSPKASRPWTDRAWHVAAVWHSACQVRSVPLGGHAVVKALGPDRARSRPRLYRGRNPLAYGLESFSQRSVTPAPSHSPWAPPMRCSDAVACHCRARSGSRWCRVHSARRPQSGQATSRR